VIIRYPTRFQRAQASVTPTIVDGNYIYTFTSTGRIYF
jgi:hypothetical protein